MSSFSSFSRTFLLRTHAVTHTIVRSFFLLLTLKSDVRQSNSSSFLSFFISFFLLLLLSWSFTLVYKKEPRRLQWNLLLLLQLLFSSLWMLSPGITRFACQKAIQLNGRNRLVSREKTLLELNEESQLDLHPNSDFWSNFTLVFVSNNWCNTCYFSNCWLVNSEVWCHKINNKEANYPDVKKCFTALG